MGYAEFYECLIADEKTSRHIDQYRQESDSAHPADALPSKCPKDFLSTLLGIYEDFETPNYVYVRLKTDTDWSYSDYFTRPENQEEILTRLRYKDPVFTFTHDQKGNISMQGNVNKPLPLTYSNIPENIVLPEPG